MKSLMKTMLLVLVSLTLLAAPAAAQSSHAAAHPWASNLVVPQSRVISADRSQVVVISGVKVEVSILEQAAVTTMDLTLQNPTRNRLEAQVLMPVPEGAAIKGFELAGSKSEPTAELLPKDKAVAEYKSIVASMRDPGLLEFAGYNLIKSSVFPIDAGGTQKVRLSYEHLLPSDAGRVDYILPRTEAVDYRVPWEVTLKIESKHDISTVYSPSHKVAVTRANEHKITVAIDKAAMAEPGPLQLSYLQSGVAGRVTASLMAYPDPKIDGGYFLLLAGLPPRDADDSASAVKREITLVIDRSGSMAGDKIKQVQAAALQIVEGLDEGEAFNILDYSDTISSFAAEPVLKNKKSLEDARHYIRSLKAAGGTNLNDAITEALRPKPMKDMLPLVLFLTDGLPTVGVRSEVDIRSGAIKANTYNRRIFTFGVGYDVNAPLLTHLATNSRATSTFVLPNEDVEAKVSQVYRRLVGPVLAEPTLAVLDKDGKPSTVRVADLMPGKVPDLFEGDQLVVLGKYKDGEQPLHFKLSGNYRGKAKAFEFEFKMDKATTRNNFVPRLWASRKIAMLIDEIRQAGAETGGTPQRVQNVQPADGKMKELTDEIVRLSLEFGILTEYTAFLAKDGTNLGDVLGNGRQAMSNLDSRAVQTRSGMGAVNQAYNFHRQSGQTYSNRTNGYVDENMRMVQITNVQQASDRAFFRQNNRWVDTNAINVAKVTTTTPASQPTADVEVKFGTPEFDKLLEKLIRDNRQGAFSMTGEILVNVDGKNYLIKGE